MLLPLFAVTLFVSAFLLFLVQPMIGKMILPRLGGTPQVWNTCMVFFQTALLAGYAYTHTVSTGLTLRRQLMVHCILLLIPLLVLLPVGPFNITGFEPPPGANPIGYTLYYLALVVGLPFFVVSTSAPLLQKWFAYTGHHTARDPYFLYGASNLGSMLALLAYPFLVEPFLFLRTQAWTWAIGYVVLVGFVLACAMVIWRTAPNVKLAGDTEGDLPSPEQPVPPLAETSTAVQSGPPPGVARIAGRKKGLKIQPKQAPKPIAKAAPAPPRPDVMTWWRRLRWVLLAAAPSSLMLGAITYMSTDLSPIPLLWVCPLALYLLTFILVFARYPVPWTGTPHTVTLVFQSILALLLVLIMVRVIGVSPIWASTLLTLLAFFFTAMVCHGELARDRPSTRHLTEFFLWMSVGGMLGGLFNGLIAPLIFKGVAEYGVALVVACLMRPEQKTEGWSDEALTGMFPGLPSWFADMGKNLARIPAMTFALVVLLGAATVAGLLFLVGSSSEWPAFLVLVFYAITAIIVIVLMALRFKPSFTLSYFLDGFYPFLILCLGTFFAYNAMSTWGWVSANPDKSPLARILKFVGLDPARYVMRSYQILSFGIPLMFALFFAARPLRYGLTIGAVLMIHLYGSPGDEDRTLYAGRSYFGVLRVYRSAEELDQDTIRELEKISGKTVPRVVPYTYLMHGTTHHGLNYQSPKELRRLATTYYHRMGPTGIVMEELNWFGGKGKAPQNTYWSDSRLTASFAGLGGSMMGVGNLPMAQLVCAWSEPPYATVGLGTGTMASYGRPFQHVTFYEIDHTIRSFHVPPYSSAGVPFFNYLQDAVKRGVALEIVMGDARLSMDKNFQGQLYVKDKEGEVQPAEAQLNPNREGYYRVIELDAFSSDAIPVHLITENAIQMYFTKLCEQGVLCVHTSNRHVDLVTPVVDIASKLGLAWRVGKDNGGKDGGGSGYLGHFGQEYVMLARKMEYLPKGDDVALSDMWVRSLAASKVSADDIENARPVVSKLTGDQYMVWYTPSPKGNAVWTDDYSNLVGVLRESLALTIFFVVFLIVAVYVALVLIISKSFDETPRLPATIGRV